MLSFLKSRSMSEVYNECIKNGISSSVFIKYSECIFKLFDSCGKELLQGVPTSLLHSVLCELTMLCALIDNISLSSSKRQVISAITLYVTPKFSKENVSVLIKYINDLTFFEKQTNAGTFFNIFKEAQNNWHLIVESTFFSQLSHLVGLSVLMVCGSRNHTKLDVNSLHKFFTQVSGVHKKSVDIISMVIDTVISFVEKLCVYVVDGDWRSFFLDNPEYKKFDQDYFDILKLSEAAEFGYLEDHGLTDDIYSSTLEELLNQAKILHDKVRGTFERKVYHERIVSLQKMITTFEAKRSHGGLRQAPLGIAITGASSSGKSTITNHLMASILSFYNLGGKESVVTLNEQDKFDSNMRSNIAGVILDDISNTNPDFVQTAPTNRIISLVNNIIQTAVMPEANQKGKIQLRPKLVIATSNLEDLGARVYSQEPVSIVRRMEIIVRVSVKPEYCLPQSKMLDTSKIPYNEDIPDLWDFEVLRCVGVPDNTPGSNRPDRVTYVPHDVGKEGSISLKELIAFCITYYGKYADNQKQLVKNANNMFEFYSKRKCSKCNSVTCDCWEKQACLIEPLSVLQELDNRFYYFINRVVSYISSPLWYWNYARDLPGLCSTLLNITIVMITLQIFVSIFLLSHPMAYCFIALYILYTYFMAVSYRYNELYSMVDNRSILTYITEYRMRCASRLLLTSTFTLIVYKVAKTLRSARKVEYQANLEPQSEEDIKLRDNEDNPWCNVRVEPLPASKQSFTITTEQFHEKISKNLYYCETEGGSHLSILFFKGNFALIPAHMLYEPGVKEEYVVNLRKDKGDTNATVYRARLSKTFSYKIPGKDVAVCWIPNVPPASDIIHYFADSRINRRSANFMRRNSEGVLDIVSARIDSVLIDKYLYVLPYKTYIGLCGNVLLHEEKVNTILGIHTMGQPNKPIGCAHSIYRLELTEALNFLKMVNGVIVSASEGDFPSHLYEKQICIGTDVHNKSPVRFMPKGSVVKVFGECEGRSSPKSSVVDSLISDTVTDVFNVPNLYGPPKFKGVDGNQVWFPWQATLEKVSSPTIGVRGDLLNKAVYDYLEPLYEKILDPYWQESLSPLTDVDNVSGQDGVRFINALNSASSIGFPLQGPKKVYMFDLDPTLFDHNSPRMLDLMFINEYRNMEKKALYGERSYPVFKACLKDEPTKKTKDKVRVFQAASVAHQLILRKYFLPIARFLSMYPLLTECAVGVNAVSPEWDQLSHHITKYGKKRILAGDYSKYDLTMSPQLISAAFDVIISLAKKCMNYKAVHITIMENLVADVCYPITAYNGDLLQFLGTNPSGQTLTVYINSIVNSLLFRCGFFQMFPHTKDTFRQCCALITYGDDAKSSVKQGYDKFNHISYAEFLDSIGMKFTMPDKESIPTKYMHDRDADLLKRKNIYNPDLGYYVGCLDDESIFKGLHSHLKSKELSHLEQSIEAVDNAAMEWFYYGREKFDNNTQKLLQVAEKHNFKHLCVHATKQYDTLVKEWKEKYL